MKDIIVWLIHTPAGTVGLTTAVVAFCSKKGSVLHRRAGIGFTISMMIMLVSGLVAAMLKESTGDIFLSAVVMYTVFTAWLTAHHKENEIGILEYLALMWIIIIAVTSFFVSVGWRDVPAANAYLFCTGFAVLCAIGDIRNISLSGLSDNQRLIRHVWRNGFSVLWAALAFTDKIVKLRGSNVKDLPVPEVLLIVAAPTMLILLATLYWISRILFSPVRNS